MSVFGEVWLWSVAAFALGALLAWVLLARPAQARVRELERRLVTAEVARAAPAPSRDPEPTRVQPALAKDDDSAHTQQIQRMQPSPRPEPEPDRTEYVSSAPAWLERDSVERRASLGEPGRDETIERELAEYDWEADPEPGYGDATGYPQTQAGAGYDETEYEREDRRAREQRANPAGSQPEETSYFQDFGTRSTFPDRDQGQQGYPAQEDRAPEREHVGASLFQPTSYPEDDDASDEQDTPAEDRGTYGAGSYAPFEPVYVGPQVGEQDIGQRDTGEQQDERHQKTEQEEPETEPETETAQGLPKRHRRESPRGGFDPPKPIQPSMRTVSRREPAQEQGGTHSGSLFEPSVPSGPSAEPPAPMPPPTRHHEEGAAPVPSGPFGPGSAMPLPGGGRPGPDFTVKASVTAFRYCAEGSAQFPQMIAEVWFRTATDAERVGFRPLA